jgi:hypothetical protein
MAYFMDRKKIIKTDIIIKTRDNTRECTKIRTYSMPPAGLEHAIRVFGAPLYSAVEQRSLFPRNTVNCCLQT